MANLKVLFVKDVPGSAKAGEVKDVKPGYARNYLLPHGIALLANDKTVDQLLEREEAVRRRAEKDLAEAKNAASRIKKLTVTIFARAGEGGRLHGSVTNADIAKQLKLEAGVELDKRKIAVDPPIKTLGPHEVVVELHPEISETLKIVVASQ